MSKPFQVSPAPETLWHAISPWTFCGQGAQYGLINIEPGQMPRPDIGQKILEQVGSCGRQLGRIGEVSKCCSIT